MPWDNDRPRWLGCISAHRKRTWPSCVLLHIYIQHTQPSICIEGCRNGALLLYCYIYKQRTHAAMDLYLKGGEHNPVREPFGVIVLFTAFDGLKEKK